MNCAVQVCPDRDVECGMFPRSWCDACPLRAPHDLAKTVAYAKAEYDSWSPEKHASVRLEGSSYYREKS